MNELHSPVKLTQQWIAKVIIGLNFCPFAKREFERQSIRYTKHDGINVDGALSAFLDELDYLVKHTEIETTLLIFEHGFSNFEDYLELAGMATALLEQGGYSGIFQLATFHPDYCFEGEAPDDPANYTNRAPYPILHILREAGIERVLRNYKSPQDIPANNIIKAREMGIAALRKLTSI